MKLYILLLFTMIITTSAIMTDFLTEQKKFERVKTAFNEKGTFVTNTLKKIAITTNEINILIVAYKAEKKLEIYAKKKSVSSYKRMLTYDICASSGVLGPKRKQGDEQVPEGFYHIAKFNPASNYYLSLGINYPNQSDKKKSKASDLGGDIYIHGDCVTIGCLPMTDDKIKEIYLFAIHARNNGQTNIPVYIFPFKMTDENAAIYKEKYKSKVALLKFWLNLKTGYDKFIKEKKELNVSVDDNGNYTF